MMRLKIKNWNMMLTETQQKLSSRKNDKYKYLTGKEILSFDQSRKIEKAKFIYSPLGKAFKK